MDNHKDFIHIDDVFRDLRNGEEREGSGAWSRMKDLLDKEMPAGTPVSGGRSFRRYIIPLAALLVLGGGGAAYYQLNREKQPAQATAITAPANNNISSNTPGHYTAESKPGADDLLTGEDHTTHTRPSASKDIAGTINNKNNTTTPAKAAAGTAIAAGDKHNTTRTEQTQTGPDNNHTKDNKTTGIAHQPAATGHNESSRTVAGKEQPANVLQEQRVIETLRPKNTSNPAPASQPAFAMTPVNTTSGNKNVFGSGNKDLKQIAADLNNKKIVQAEDGNLYKENRDTIKRIDIVEKTVASRDRSSVRNIVDTVAITRVERISYTPLTPIEVMVVRKINITLKPAGAVIPVASLNTRVTSSEMVDMVPLANYKVGSRRMDPGKFNQLIQNTSTGISNYFDGSRNFYMALIAGGNVSFGNPTAFGMQLGVAGLYSLSERLTLTAELRYVNHYFSNYTLQDQSVTFENVSSQQSGSSWLFSGSQTTATSNYKISNYGSLELPVTLSYNLGRVSIFAGANIAYGFPMKWTKESSLNTADVQQTRDQNQNPFINSVFKVNEQRDFGSRIGLGYLWGLNYDLSRKVSLDARVSQVLWDNGKGNAEAINRLFRIPSLQFSFGYYFGRKDKVIYIMERK